jgi:hypothetical protein
MSSNTSSANEFTVSTGFKLQDLSHDHRKLPYSDEESSPFLSEHQEKDVKDHQIESNQNRKKASFWIVINIIATVLIVRQFYSPLACVILTTT